MVGRAALFLEDDELDDLSLVADDRFGHCHIEVGAAQLNPDVQLALLVLVSIAAPHSLDEVPHQRDHR